MNYLAIGYGVFMIGYAAVLAVMLRKSSPGEGMTTWVVSHAALRGSSGLLMLTAAFAAGAASVLVTCAGLALLADVAVTRHKKRRLREAGALSAVDKSQ
jgi:hypothetical protein